MDALNGIWERVPVFLLVFPRIAGLLVAFPLLSARALPVHIRALLAFGLAWAFLPLVPKAVTLPIGNELMWGIAIVREALIGLSTGWVAQVLLASVPVASQVLGYQMGLGIATVMDPAGQHQIGVIAQFLQLLALWLFLSVDGHHWALLGIFGAWSPNIETWFSLTPQVLLDAGRQVFSGALALAAPALLILLFVQVGLGIMARMMPQMNIFLVTAPFQVGLGLLAMGLAVGALIPWLSKGMRWLVGVYSAFDLGPPMY